MAQPEWTVNHLEHDDSLIVTLRPEDLTFTLNKGENGPHTVNYNVSRSRNAIEPDFIGPYRTDFELLRDDDVIIAGMHTMLGVNSDEEMAQVAGKGWLHYLQRCFWPFNDTDFDAYVYGFGLVAPTLGDPFAGYAYSAVNQEVMDIITDMLTLVLSFDDTLPITHSLVSISHDIEFFSIDLIDTESIYDKIVTLSQEDPGEFDFWVDNNKEFHRIAPRKYNVANVVSDENDDDIMHIFDSEVLDSGLHAVRFTNTGPDATWLLGYGASQSHDLADVRQYGPAITTYRRLMNIANFPGIITPERVQRLTRKKLLFGLNPVHEITIEVVTDRVANFWTNISPGCAIWLKADLEAHVIDSAQEVVSIECTPDISGNELAVLKLNQIYGADTIS